MLAALARANGVELSVHRCGFPTRCRPQPNCPGLFNRQPATGNRQPATGNRQPATGNRQEATYARTHVIGSWLKWTTMLPVVSASDRVRKPRRHDQDAPPARADAKCGHRNQANEVSNDTERDQTSMSRVMSPIKTDESVAGDNTRTCRVPGFRAGLRPVMPRGGRLIPARWVTELRATSAVWPLACGRGSLTTITRLVP
jgi:hypothetical protein